MIPVSRILASIPEQEKSPTVLLLISVIEQQQQIIDQQQQIIDQQQQILEQQQEEVLLLKEEGQLLKEKVGVLVKLPPILGQRLKTIFMHNLP